MTFRIFPESKFINILLLPNIAGVLRWRAIQLFLMQYLFYGKQDEEKNECEEYEEAVPKV